MLCVPFFNATSAVFGHWTTGLEKETRVWHANHSEDHATWCALHSARGEYLLAIQDCNDAISADPRNPQHYANRGSAYLLLNELEQALLDFDKALTLNPDDARLYYNRGLAHARKGEREMAIADYTEAIRRNPQMGMAYNNRGYELELLGEHERALADYRKAFKLTPSSDVVRRNLERLDNKR
jgi:tetratricopeptide (TPR) repeat protein